ncbi:hypothetical protein HMPREF2681_01900 [Corynebacterium sp. HMSC064H12]|uniref:hypothetical protein n=1 Tax=Corynebacterium sp. HMSC064H12 TaxID=1715160 RepID=UPI0008A24F7F|nr:hypothetical protein [Corynebacterium sp. HMSC064H12]OFM53096.1 hypothetical protein HMPREF2681_01900 [Corynebacterium sp. HMSC064H12]
MTTIFVDLVNLDGSRPEGSLRFSLERLVLGDPDVVPSAVEVKIRDGKARVDDLLPGAMRVRVGAGCWSKDWQIMVPESGEHDLFELLEWQAEDFQETVWAALDKRVEALENTPAVDLAPVEQRLDALEGAPKVDLAPLEKRVGELEPKLDEVSNSLKMKWDAFWPVANQTNALWEKLNPELFDPAELKTQLAELRAHLTPVELLDDEAIYEDFAAIYDLGSEVQVIQHAGRVDINISAFDLEGLLRALDGLKLPHFPKVKMFPQGGFALCDVELYQGAKFVTKLQKYLVRLAVKSSDDMAPNFAVEVDDALAVVQETGANRMNMSTFYYTDDLPPETN